MNELEILMKSEAKKKAIEKSAKEEIQRAEFEKARKWKKETLEKLSFLKNYGASLKKILQVLKYTSLLANRLYRLL